MSISYQQLSPISTASQTGLCRLRMTCNQAITAALLFTLGLTNVLAAAPDPHQQMMQAVQALRQNDLTKLFNDLVPEEERKKMAEEWDILRQEPVTEEDRQQFNASFGMLLAPNAADIVMTLVQPQLSQMRESWSTQIEGLEGLVMFAIASAEDLSQEDRDQATRGIQAVAKWARENDLTDEALARQAITAAVNTAQSLEIQNIEELKALPMDEALIRGGKLLAGVKAILEVYGISLNAILDSFSAETTWREDNKARLKVAATLFGEHFETETDLEYIDGKWINPQAQQSLAAIGSLKEGSPTVKQPMPEIADTPSTASNVDTINAPEPALSAAEVYLAYRAALPQANSFEQISSYWMNWVGASAANQDDATRMAKLTSLQQAAYNVQIVGARYQEQQVTLDVVGDSQNGQALDGQVILAAENQQWRIRDIGWAARTVAMTMPAQKLPAITASSATTLVVSSQQAVVTTMDQQTDPVETESVQPTVNTPTTVATKENLQQDFDKNPFLKHYDVKIAAQGLEAGFLTAEISGGSESLIASIGSGYDVVEGDIETLSNNKDKQIALAVRKTVVAIQRKYGLLAVLLVTSGADTETGKVVSGTTEPSTGTQMEAEPTESDVAKSEVTKSPEETEQEAQAKAEAEKQAQLVAAKKQEERRKRVQQIQTLLNQHGFDAGVADGKAGKGTRAAIRAYQRAAGLTEDGQPGTELLAHLNSDAAVDNPALVQEPEPETVATEDIEEEEPEEPKKKSKVKSFFNKILGRDKGKQDAE